MTTTTNQSPDEVKSMQEQKEARQGGVSASNPLSFNVGFLEEKRHLITGFLSPRRVLSTRNPFSLN
jgi:hypothetical protein